MTVSFWIPRPLTPMTDGRGRVEIEVSGGTLRDALETLFVEHPGLRDRVLTEQWQIREHVNVFVGTQNVRSASGFATPLAEGIEISIIPAISGG